jgi:hypothetical protein
VKPAEKNNARYSGRATSAHMKGRKGEKNGLPEHLKAILKDVGLKDVDSTAVEVALQQRAAAQVQDYVHIMAMKLSHFSGPRVSSPVAALAQILDGSASGKRPKRAQL